MNNEQNATRIDDADAFLAEFDAQNEKGAAEYKRMLRRLCPSREMRKKAKRISNGKLPCDKCAYYEKSSGKCSDPHSAMYNMFIDVDHCYEGILRYFAAEAQRALEDDNEAKDALINKMDEEIQNAVDIAFTNMEIIRTFSRWIIMIADGKWKMPLEAVKCVRETLDWLNEVLPPDGETAGTDGE